MKSITKEQTTAPKAMNRWLVLAAGCVMLIFVGLPNLWSLFQPDLMKIHGWSAGTTSAAFTILMCFFVLGNIVGGRIQDRFDPTHVILAGTVLMGVGFFLSAYTPSSMPFVMYLTYSLCVGLGNGFIYAAVIATVQKWFLDKKGLATGFIVSAAGSAGLLLTPIVRPLVVNLGVIRTFQVLAVAVTVVSLLLGLFIKLPPAEYHPASSIDLNALMGSQRDLTPSELLKDKRYYLLMFSMFLAVPPFFIINPTIVTIASGRGLSETLAVITVAFSSLFNIAGRLSAPAISDKVGRKPTVLGLFSLSLLGLILVMFARGIFLFVPIALIFYAYGGFWGCYPSITSDLFGIKNAGINYGLVLLSVAASTVTLPMLASFLESTFHSDIYGFTVAAICAVVGAFLVSRIRFPKGKLLK